jgi:hypothetical protein
MPFPEFLRSHYSLTTAYRPQPVRSVPTPHPPGNWDSSTRHTPRPAAVRTNCYAAARSGPATRRKRPHERPERRRKRIRSSPAKWCRAPSVRPLRAHRCCSSWRRALSREGHVGNTAKHSVGCCNTRPDPDFLAGLAGERRTVPRRAAAVRGQRGSSVSSRRQHRPPVRKWMTSPSGS